MINPIYQIKEKQTSFTFFHTHVLDQSILDQAIKSGKSVEIDVSIDDKGNIYVGHPLSYYRTRNLPNPTNVSLEEIIAQARKANLYLVFDCKHVRVLPKVQEMIQKYGSDRSTLHAFVKELSIKPWPPKIVEQSEESWPDEELPVAEVLKVKLATGVPVVLSCHGITLDRLESEKDILMQSIVDVAKGKAEIVNLFLPKDEVMPIEFADRMLDNGIIPLVSERTPINQRPKVYLGATDDLAMASDLADFQ